MALGFDMDVMLKYVERNNRGKRGLWLGTKWFFRDWMKKTPTDQWLKLEAAVQLGGVEKHISFRRGV